MCGGNCRDTPLWCPFFVSDTTVSCPYELDIDHNVILPHESASDQAYPYLYWYQTKVV